MLGVDMHRAIVMLPSTTLESGRTLEPFWVLDGFADRQQKQLIDNYLVVACAGWGAEMIVYGDVDEHVSADDMEIFRETVMDSSIALVQSRVHKRVDLFLQSFQERRRAAAVELLEPHQHLLYGVARLLIQKQTVQAAEIHALLDRMLIEGE